MRKEAARVARRVGRQDSPQARATTSNRIWRRYGSISNRKINYGKTNNRNREAGNELETRKANQFRGGYSFSHRAAGTRGRDFKSRWHSGLSDPRRRAT